ncbi:MAG TPA: LysR family transcriptional regulator [Polyangiales bacterium]|jgi:DNA-binding transcriptional LysR family regulator|nr:LysR family transcriptional regulator [Polyangiales bacterium]
MNAIHAAERIAPGALAGIDLNLVVAFDALAHDRSVTLAAQRIGVTQSAMSHALRRLRVLLGDPLLVRGQSGMVLTPRAELLAIPVRSGLVTLGRALSGPLRFEPGSARRAFRIATPDLFDVLVIPALLERVRVEAPGVDLSVVPIDPRRLPALLETGDVDASIVPRFEQVSAQPLPLQESPGLVRRVLFRDDYSCLIRADHVALRGGREKRKRGAKAPRLSIEAYAALNHLSVSPGGDGRGVIDRALEQHGLTRRIALRIPAFYTALEMVRRSDLILTAPSALARFVPEDGSVVAFPPPISVPSHTLNLTWHERFTQDPGHVWLRELVTEVSREEMRAG